MKKSNIYEFGNTSFIANSDLFLKINRLVPFYSKPTTGLLLLK